MMNDRPTNTDNESAAPYAQPANFYLATVVSGSGNKWKVKFNGTDSSTTKAIKSAYGLMLGGGHKVLVIEINGTFMIIARIT